MSVPKPSIWRKREQTGLSRERAAAQLDPPVSSKTIERWEHGVTPIPGWRKTQLEKLYNDVLRSAA